MPYMHRNAPMRWNDAMGILLPKHNGADSAKACRLIFIFDPVAKTSFVGLIGKAKMPRVQDLSAASRRSNLWRA